MDDDKAPANVEAVLAEDALEITEGHEAEKKGTGYDQRDMVRMGKRQETRVRHTVLLQSSNNID